MKRSYVVIDTQGRFRTDGGRWSPEYPDARLYGLGEGKTAVVLQCYGKHPCRLVARYGFEDEATVSDPTFMLVALYGTVAGEHPSGRSTVTLDYCADKDAGVFGPIPNERNDEAFEVYLAAYRAARVSAERVEAVQ